MRHDYGRKPNGALLAAVLIIAVTVTLTVTTAWVFLITGQLVWR